MFYEYEEMRELTIQLSSMNDLELCICFKVNDNGEYVIKAFGFEDKNGEVMWGRWRLIDTFMPTSAIIDITNQIRITAQDDPAVDPELQDEYEGEEND